MASTIRIAIVANAVKARSELDATAKAAGKLGRASSPLKDNLGKLGKGAAIGAAGLTAFGASSLSAFTGALKAANATSRLTGLSVTQASQLNFAASQVGLSADDMATNMGRLSKNLVNAPKTFAALGVATRDASGNLRPMSELIPAVADKFAAMKDGPEKTALAMKLFGKSGAQMLPLLNKGSQGLADLAKQSDATGNTIRGGSGDLKAQMAAQRQWQATLQGLKVTLGAALMPIIAKLAGWFTVLLQRVQPHLPLITRLAGVFAVVVAAAKAWTIAQAALNFVLSANPIGLIVIAVAGLIAGLVMAYRSSETFRNIVTSAFSAVANVVGSVVGFVKDHWRLMISVLLGPFGIAIALITKHFGSIKAAAGAVLAWFPKAWGVLKSIVLTPIKAGIDLAVGTFTRIKDTVGQVKAWITGAFTGAKDWLADAGRKIIDGFVDALKAGFRKVKDALGSLTDLLPSWKGPASRDATLLVPAARLIMSGFQRGLESRYSAVRSSLSGLTSDLASAATGGAGSGLTPFGSGNGAGGVVTVRNSGALAPNAREILAELQAYCRTNGPIRGLAFS